jgi:hypothetical protein
MTRALAYRPARAIRPAPRRARPQLGQLAALGAGSVEAQQIVGSAGAIATAVTTAGTSSAIVGALPFMAAAGPAAPFVAIGAIAATLLAKYIGGGCGSACTNAAKAEQIYEAAADNMRACYVAGMMTAGQFQAICQALIQSGQQHLATFGTKQAQAGSANLTNVITAEMNALSGAPATLIPVNLAAAHSLYVSGGGWYPDSLAAAAQLSDSYLQSLPAPATSTTGSIIGGTGITGSLGTAATSFFDVTIAGIPLWIIAGGAAAFFFLRD